MLKGLKINNFRCFDEHTIEFGTLNIAVGVNNAGKTTVAEALRIVSIVTQRYYNISAYKDPPDWLFIPRRFVGFKVSLKNLEINFNTLIYRFGKTQLAVEFAYRFSFAFDSVHWIQAADAEQWRSKLVELARDRLGLSISDPDKPPSDRRYLFKLQKYFKKNPQTLIIMDNVVEPKLLNNDSFLYGVTPLTLGCDLLFNTRQHFRLKDVTSQAVDVLSPESAYTLLTHDRKPSTPQEEDHARTICIAIGYLPLAIILAAGYLNEYTDVSFSDYQAELIKNKLDVIDIGELSEEELATRHVAAVGITLEEDWKKITDKNARFLFQLAGQFGEAEIIPRARLGLTAISELAADQSLSVDDFLSILSLLTGPDKAFIQRVYYRRTPSGEEIQVPASEVVEQTRRRVYDREIDESQWRSWASDVLVRWTPVDKLVDSRRIH